MTDTFKKREKVGEKLDQQEYIPVGCVPSAAVAVWRVCVSARGVCVCLEGVCLPGGCLPGGVCRRSGCLPVGGYLPMEGGVYPGRGRLGGVHLPPPSVNRMTDRCKNITFL